MNKELIIKLLTGNLAKLARYAITAWGFHDAATSADWAKLEGAIGIILAFAWSIAEDKYKERKAKQTLLPLIACVCLLTGCASYETIQKDSSTETDPRTGVTTVREITTTVKAKTRFEGKSQLAQFKASTTDKTQSTSVGSLSQEATSTNAAAVAKSVAEGVAAGLGSLIIPKK